MPPLRSLWTYQPWLKAARPNVDLAVPLRRCESPRRRRGSKVIPWGIENSAPGWNAEAWVLHVARNVDSPEAPRTLFADWVEHSASNWKPEEVRGPFRNGELRWEPRPRHAHNRAGNHDRRGSMGKVSWKPRKQWANLIGAGVQHHWHWSLPCTLSPKRLLRNLSTGSM